MAQPIYFESSWAELSTIGLINTIVGFMIMGITGYSPIALVPITVSAAAAVADGMSFYAFYENRPKLNTAIASGFADVSWLIQEAGLSFYSFMILRRVLEGRRRTIFLSLFWTLMAVISGIRMVILVTRIRFILGGSASTQLQSLVDNLHVGYFSSIALVEIISAFFLLRRFQEARHHSVQATASNGPFSYLMRSTEVRLALLAIIGITRAITYSFQRSAQSATSTATQLDRFAYSLECLFPIVMYIDILASRLVFTTNTQYTSSGARRQRQVEEHAMRTIPRGDHTVDIELAPEGSQEYIEYGKGSTSNFDMPNFSGVAITKTVEFRVDAR